MPDNTFVNWAGNQRCLTEGIESPRTVDEVAHIVTDAHRRRSRVKVVGSGHSFTAAACTDGTLLRVDGINRLHSLDADTGVATVGAGIGLRDLSEQLDRRGRALPNLGDIDVQTLAGATATATHGTGATFGNLSTGIVGMELVTGTGEVLWCDRDTNAEVWSAARVSLGALGVITKIAVQTVPAFGLEARETVEDIDDVMADWPAFARSAAHAEAIWLPGTTKALVKRNHPTDAPLEPMSKSRWFLDKMLLENVALGGALKLTRYAPGTTERVTKVIASLAAESTRIDKSYRIFASPRHIRFVEMEYALPFDVLPDAFDRLRHLIGSMDRPIAFPVEIRSSAADDIPLSTAQGRDSAWIAVHQTKGVPFGDYFRGVEAIMNDFGGRPHWGKMHFHSVHSLRDLYPQWQAFRDVRATVDPDGTYTNEYLTRVLDPIGRP